MNLFLLPLGLGVLLLAVAATRRVAIDRRRAEHEAAAGLEVVRTLRWKEFTHYVSQSFEARGYVASTPERLPGIEGPDVLLARGDERLLLQVKHGGSYSVGAGPVRTLAALVTRDKAQGGVIATSGGFDGEAAEAAKGHLVTLLGGTELWGALRGLLPPAMVSEVDERALVLARQARSKITGLAIAGAALVLLGAGLWTLDALERRGTTGEPAPASRVEAAPPEPAPAPAPAAVSAPPAPAAVPTTPAPTPPAAQEPTEKELVQQREFAAAETLLVPEVASASWSTPSTLAIALRGPLEETRRSEILRDVCARVVAREALRFTRLQVEMLGEPAAAATGPRWFACR